MGDSDGTISWYSSDSRAIFFPDSFIVHRSFAKTLRKNDFSVTYDQAFRQVMESCIRTEDGAEGNWITGPILDCYTGIHREGWGHSCEVWREGRLVGGVYGIAIGRAFFAESMFHRETDMSKVALWALLEKVRELGFDFVEAQFPTPHLQSLGAQSIPSRKYLSLLQNALNGTTAWSYAGPLDPI